MRKSNKNGDRRATDDLAGPKRVGEALGDMATRPAFPWTIGLV